MRVLFCTDTYLPQMNGVSGRHIVSVEGLSARGWDLRRRRAPRIPVAATGWRLRGSAPVKYSGVRQHPHAIVPKVRLSLPVPAPFGELIEGFRPDLVHCATEFGVGRRARSRPPGARSPWCRPITPDFARYADAYGAGWLRATVPGYLGPISSPKPPSVYSVERSPARTAVACGVEGSHVEVWGRGVEAEAFHTGAPQSGDACGAGDGEPVHLRLRRPACVGKAGRRDNRSLPGGERNGAPGRDPPGDGRHRSTRGGAAGGGARPACTFLGVLDRAVRLPDLYANCDAFVFASVTETLGLVVLEAMASGLPVDRRALSAGCENISDTAERDRLPRGRRVGHGAVDGPDRDRVGPEPAAGSRRQAHRGAAELGPGDRATGAELSRGVGAVSAGRLDRPGRGRGQPLTCSGVGEPAGDRRTHAPLALGGDPAAMRLHQVLHDGESQAGASFVARPRAIRPVEPLEDPR